MLYVMLYEKKIVKKQNLDYPSAQPLMVKMTQSQF